MSLTTAQAKAQLRHFTRYRTERVLELAARGEPDQIHGTLLLAIGSRESNLNNITGGGYFDDQDRWVDTGEDRGVFQISAKYHAKFLTSVPGCLNGEYVEGFSVEQGGAYPAGRVPGLTRAAEFVIGLLRDNIDIARTEAVPEDECLRVGVAGYNAGITNAVKGFNYGDPDKFTTGKDYSADVLARQRVFRTAFKELHWGSK